MRGSGLLLAGLIAGGAVARAEPVPDALRGRWAMAANQCAVPGEGLTLTADGLTFVTSGSGPGASTLVAVVDASEVGEFRARLTLLSVVGGQGDAAPEAGDSLVLERMGDLLQAIETRRGGIARDISGGDPMLRCP